MTGQIIVGVDGSTTAGEALRWAVDEALLRGWTVCAVMAWGYLNQHHAVGSDFVPGFDESDEKKELDEIVEAALGPRSSLAERRLSYNHAIPALLEAAEDADLLVLGARGRGGFEGLLLGSVSHACIHHATSPVAIIREDVGQQLHELGPVVVGIDGSPASRAALDWAVKEAALRRVPVHAVHAWSAPDTVGFPYGVAIDPGPFMDAARWLMDHELDRVDRSGLTAPIERTVVAASPVTSLLDASKDSALIVVGSRGVGGFCGTLLGSVSHQLASHSSCPVVIIPEPRSG